MKILVAFCPFPWSYGYHAWLKDNSQIRGFGSSKKEALSELIEMHPELTELEVECLD